MNKHDYKDHIHIYPHRDSYIVHNECNSSWIIVNESDYQTILEWKEYNKNPGDRLFRLLDLYGLTCKSKEDSRKDFQTAVKNVIPSTVYIVLTKECNLKCIY